MLENEEDSSQSKSNSIWENLPNKQTKNKKPSKIVSLNVGYANKSKPERTSILSSAAENTSNEKNKNDIFGKRTPSSISEFSRTRESRFYNLDFEVDITKVAFIKRSRKDTGTGALLRIDKKEDKHHKEKGTVPANTIEVTESFLKRNRELRELIKNLWNVGFTFKELGLIKEGAETVVGRTTVGEATDPLFKKIKKNQTAFLIWRVSKLDVIAVPKEHYSLFFDSECYIIYAASEYGKCVGPNTISREVKSGVEQHIHFWLGRNATNEQWYSAAFKCVELDGYAGGKTTQHREVQGKESRRFMSYFETTGIRILCGRSQPILASIQDVFIPRLYRVKGKRTPFIIQLPSLSWTHFHSGCVIILQTPHIIFLWIGRVATYTEKRNGITAAQKLLKAGKCKYIAFVDDGYEKTLLEEDLKEFDAHLPLHKRIVKHADREIEDIKKDIKMKRSSIKLYHCSEAIGKYRVTEIKGGSLYQTDLDSNAVFIIDHGTFGIWVWVGKRANEKERVEAMRNARGFVKKKKYPSYIPVTRVVEGFEPVEFKQLFTSWKDKDGSIGFVRGMVKPMPTVKVTRYDSETLYERPALAARCQLLDDGSGFIQKFMIVKDGFQEIPRERNSVFFTGECYIIKYTYDTPQGKYIALYSWMGLQSSPEDQLSTQIRTIQMDMQETNEAQVIRIIEGYETPHFLQIFKGKMRTFNGHSTDFDPSGKNLKTPSHYLLQVEGSTSYNTKAYQVNLKACRLNTNYCFVLRKSSHYFIWCGNNSTGDNREMAKAFAGNDFALIVEGKESPDFWHMINGKMEYDTKKIVQVEEDILPPRLFQLTTHPSGIFSYEEILQFTQEDLRPEYHMLLDTRKTILVWRGSLTEQETHHMVSEIVSQYLQSDPVLRDKCTSIQLIKQGFEPPLFTGFFENWNKKYWNDYKTYDELRDEIENCYEKIHMKNRNSVPFKNSLSDFDQYPKFSIDILTGPSDKLPSSVDPLKRELHLTFDDFISLIKIPYTDFKQLPTWKQQEIKKSVGLF